MKRGLIGIFLLMNALTGLAQDLPRLPLRFSFARRTQPAYLDSVLTQTRRSIGRVEQMPRTPALDTLRQELWLYLAYCYRFSVTRPDSAAKAAAQLVRMARQWGNVKYQLAGHLEEHNYYYTTRADYPEALRVNYDALRVIESNPTAAPEVRWQIEKNLGQLSYRMGKYAESITFYRRAMAAKPRRDTPVSRDEGIFLLQLMSESYKFLNRLDSAEVCSLEALQLAQSQHKASNLSMAYLHGDLAIVYRHQKRYTEALEQSQLAENLWQKVGRKNGLAATWSGMAALYLQLNEHDKALAYARKALDYDSGIPTTRLLVYEIIALAAAHQQDWSTAFRFHQRFKAMADSIEAGRKLTETMTLQANFEREKLMLRQQQEEQRYLTLQQEKALQEQEYLTLAQEAKLQQLRASSEQQRLIQLANQTNLQRKLETQALKAQAQTRQNNQQSQIKVLQMSSLQNKLRLQTQTRNFWIALTSLIGLSLLGYTQLLRRKNRALRRANNEIKAAMQHGQTQEMVALRAQMNPHFIFNCINSIKLYTLQNDTDRAADYLTKFARLIRLVLENSRSERVTLQNELEALQLYIELEAMRFKHKVRFAIQISPNIDQQFIRIPPLLLQPYVENAIWHGLMHKSEGGTVVVEVSQRLDNLLHIEIIDDGVGRQRAGQLKSKSAGKQKSFGMQVTAERTRMINELYNIQTQTQVLDLMDSFGNPCGTKIILQIPV